MPNIAPDLLVSEPETAVLDRLAVLAHTSLATVAAVVALNCAGWLAPALARSIPGGWQSISFGAAIASVLSLGSLYLANQRYSLRIHMVSLAFALLLILLCVPVLAVSLLHGSAGFHASERTNGGFNLLHGMAPQTAVAFAMLGAMLLFVRARKPFFSLLADVLLFCLIMLVLTIVSAEVFGSLAIFGPVSPGQTSSLSLVCLLLLTLAVFLRRAELGIFSILLGRSIGSKIARALCPILLVLPYFREAVRAHFINSRHMPSNYTTAILASLAAVITLALALAIAWRFNTMETEIHDLSLRDPLTGLYNLRGFRLLADQALLLARRSGQPFSVLFVDVDDLKQTNDLHGHQTGSDLLVETAEILMEAVRETDVVGRIGGDEFALAGQFSDESIEQVANRLKEQLVLRNAQAGAAAALEFSVGHVTAGPARRSTLNELLAEADEAMYQEKRRRKTLVY